MSENKKVDDYINEYFNKKSNVLETSDLFRMIEEAMGGIKVQAQKHQEVVEEDPYDEQFYKDKEELFEEFEKSMLEEINQKQPLQEAKSKGKQAETVTLSLFTGAPTENWGDPKSASFKKIRPFINKAVGGGEKSFKAKLDKLFSLINATPKEQGGDSGIISQGRIISTLVLVEALAAILNEFGDSPGGFVFEGFLAAITLGRQVSDKDEGTLPIEDIIAFDPSGPWGRPASLKMLKGRTFTAGAAEGSLKLSRSGTSVKGSWKNLINFFDKYPELDYIVAFKAGEGDRTLSIIKFTITRENIVDLMVSTGNKGLIGTDENVALAQKLSHPLKWDGKRGLRALLHGTFEGETTPEETTPYREKIKALSIEKAADMIRNEHPSSADIEKYHTEYEEIKRLLDIEGEEDAPRQKKVAEGRGKKGKGDGEEKVDTQFKLGQQYFWSKGKSVGDKLPGFEVLAADIDLSDKSLREVNERWTKVLQDNVRLLLTSFESLTENINKFFTLSDRTAGQEKGTQAAGNSKNIEQNMKDAVKEERASKQPKEG